jgi:hypothetical protein
MLPYFENIDLRLLNIPKLILCFNLRCVLLTNHLDLKVHLEDSLFILNKLFLIDVYYCLKFSLNPQDSNFTYYYFDSRRDILSICAGKVALLTIVRLVNLFFALLTSILVQNKRDIE